MKRHGKFFLLLLFPYEMSVGHSLVHWLKNMRICRNICHSTKYCTRAFWSLAFPVTTLICAIEKLPLLPGGNLLQSNIRARSVPQNSRVSVDFSLGGKESQQMGLEQTLLKERNVILSYNRFMRLYIRLLMNIIIRCSEAIRRCH